LAQKAPGTAADAIRVGGNRIGPATACDGGRSGTGAGERLRVGAGVDGTALRTVLEALRA